MTNGDEPPADEPDTTSNSADDRSLSRRSVLTSLSAIAVGSAGIPPVSDRAAAQFAPSVPLLDVRSSPPSVSGEIPTGAEEVLFFVHGLGAGGTVESQAAGFASAAGGAGWDYPVVAVRYDASLAGSGVEEGAQNLADWLGEYVQSNPSTTIRVVGHSLGGRMVMNLLAAIDGSFAVDSVAPIGAAVSGREVCERGRFHEAIERSAGEVHNYHSLNDSVICGTFGAAGSSLGCDGAGCETTPANYADVDVTDQVSNHVSYASESGCVDTIVQNFDTVRTSGDDTDTETPTGDAPTESPDGDASTGGDEFSDGEPSFDDNDSERWRFDDNDSEEWDFDDENFSERWDFDDDNSSERWNFDEETGSEDASRDDFPTETPEDDDTPGSGNDTPTGDGPPVIGDSGAAPRDPDGDGVYEDVNGNGRTDYDDVVTLFDNMESSAVTDHAEQLDLNGNGAVDFDDVVRLFNSL